MNKAMTTVNGELKLKIEELSRANSDFFNIMASTNVGVIFLDSLLQVRRFTPRATELFHLMESDIGRPCAHIAYSIRAEALGTRPLELATQVCATAEQREEVVQGDNGGWYILRLFPYRTLDNLIDGVVITLIDITERKEAEDALRASEERFRTLANAMPQLVWTANAQGDVDYYNIRIADYEPSVCLAGGGFDWPNFVHPDDLPPTFAAWQTAAARGEPYTFEHRLHMADQSWRWHLSMAMPMRQENQQIKWYGTATDIHARKQIEEALRASEAQLSAVLYNIPASVYMLTTDHRYLLVNRIFEQENNITNAEIHGLSVYDRWPPPIAEVLAANEQQVLATKAPIQIEESAWQNGETRFYSSIKAPLLDAGGEPYAIIGISTDITERKRAEEALRQSEARYRTLFETMDEGFCIFEMIFDEQHKPLDYRFLEGNPAFARFTGLENAIGKTARELVPNLEAHWFERYGNVAFTGEPLRFVQGSAAMGRWFEVYAFRFGGPESRQVALLFTNITERKQAEDQLRGQEELLRQIADNVPGLIAYIGTDERYRFVNAAFEAWFCRSRDQIIGGTALDLIGEDEHARLSGYRQQALAGANVSYETDFLYPDGVTRTVWGRYQPHFTADGGVIGFYLFVMDISERKRAEKALLESEKRFRAFFELAAVGAAQVDLKARRFTAVNDKFCALTGYTQAELAQISFVELTHPDDRALDVQMLLQREAGINDEYRVEKRYLRKDGSVIWVDLASNLIRNAAGQAPYSIAVVVDITERKAAEHALLQFNEQLEQQVKERTAELTKRLQELDQFAYVASHDMRAPLRAIDHMAQWIRDDAAHLLPPKSLGHLEKIRGRIVRMETLLNDLLAYSRADRYQYDVVQVDVALLLDDIVRLVTPSQGFAVSIPPVLPVLITSKVPLETVLRNLIHNAIKHHDRSDGQVQVTVQDLGDFYEFSVSDDGPGIPPKFHERIFQIFQTLKPRDQVEGSGMGLAIVKKAVEHYGGTVSVTSDGQRGTTFAFTWPKELPRT